MFDVCQTDLATPGLMLEDVQKEECVTFADELVGLGNSDVDELFKAADANEDGIVLRSEVNEVFQSLALSRSGYGSKQPCNHDMDGNLYKCSGTESCCDWGYCRSKCLCTTMSCRGYGMS